MALRRKPLTEAARRAERVQVKGMTSRMLNRPVSAHPAVSGAQQWSDSVKARLPSRLEVSVDFDGDNSTGRLSFKRFEYSRPSGKEVSGSEAFGSGGSAFVTERDLWENAICDAIAKFVEQNFRVYGWMPAVE